MTSEEVRNHLIFIFFVLILTALGMNEIKALLIIIIDLLIIIIVLLSRIYNKLK